MATEEPVDIDLPAPHRRRVRSVITLVVVAVAALVAVAVAIVPDDGDVDVAVDEDEDETATSTSAAPDVTMPPPAPIVFGSADDGKDSVGLPVTASPSSGLVDGQTVSVSGSGFPPGVAVGVVMCTREAGAEYGGRGVEACNLGRFGQGTTSADGQVTVAFAVQRLVTLDGREVDCASEPGRCILGMGMIDDYDQSGGVAIDFDPSVPLPDPPSAVLARTSGIVDGETVDLTVTGLTPGGYVSFSECGPDERCTLIGESHADGDGRVAEGIRLWRTFGAWLDGNGSTNVDCAVVTCTLQVWAEAPGQRMVSPVDISFDPSRGARTPPSVSLTEPGPFADGEEVTLLVTGMRPGEWAEASICTNDGSACMGGAGGAAGPDGTAQLVFLASTRDLGFEGGPADPGICAAGCLVVVATYIDQPVGTGPPPLMPAPVPITIEP